MNELNQNQRFSYYWQHYVKRVGQQYAYDMWVGEGYMKAWEFRFWMGHRGLV
jgi:hypothetical protein